MEEIIKCLDYVLKECDRKTVRVWRIREEVSKAAIYLGAVKKALEAQKEKPLNKEYTDQIQNNEQNDQVPKEAEKDDQETK